MKAFLRYLGELRADNENLKDGRGLTTYVLREPGVRHERNTERLAVGWKELVPGPLHLVLLQSLGFLIS